MPGSSLSRHLESGVDPGNEVVYWGTKIDVTDLKGDMQCGKSGDASFNKEVSKET